MLRFLSTARRALLPLLVTLTVFVGLAAAQTSPLPTSGTAEDPTSWKLLQVHDAVEALHRMQSQTGEQARQVRQASERLAEAVSGAQNDPRSEPHKRAVLSAALEAVDVVQTALQTALADQPVVEEAFERDRARLERFADGLDKEIADLGQRLQDANQKAEEEAAKADRHLLSDEVDDEALEEAYRAHRHWQRKVEYYEARKHNQASERKLIEKAESSLRNARLRIRDEFEDLHDLASSLAAVVGTFEVVGQHMETLRVCAALDGMAAATQALSRETGVVDGLDRAVGLLTRSLLHEVPGIALEEKEPTNGFEQWKRRRLSQLQSGGGK